MGEMSCGLEKDVSQNHPANKQKKSTAESNTAAAPSSKPRRDPKARGSQGGLHCQFPYTIGPMVANLPIYNEWTKAALIKLIFPRWPPS